MKGLLIVMKHYSLDSKELFQHLSVHCFHFPARIITVLAQIHRSHPCCFGAGRLLLTVKRWKKHFMLPTQPLTNKVSNYLINIVELLAAKRGWSFPKEVESKNRAKRRVNVGFAFIRWPGGLLKYTVLLTLYVPCCTIVTRLLLFSLLTQHREN